jgi:hypothetical protein
MVETSMVESVNDGNFDCRLFSSRMVHIDEPTSRELAEKVGLQTKAAKPFYDLIIIGAGQRFSSSGIWWIEGLQTVIIEKKATVASGTSPEIENYLGFPQGLSGADLASISTQAIRFNVRDPETPKRQRCRSMIHTGLYY